MTSSINRFFNAIKNLERVILWHMHGPNHPPPLMLEICSVDRINTPQSKFNISDIIGDGFTWAVPKFRRTVEKRMKRKFGHPEYHMKLLLPKKNIIVCNACGHNHEIGCVCPHCYQKVCLETKRIQKKIQSQLGLKAIEEDVVVLYEGEMAEQPEKFWEGKRLIEMRHPRPKWFSKNLLQKTTQQPAVSKDVKPTELA